MSPDPRRMRSTVAGWAFTLAGLVAVGSAMAGQSANVAQVSPVDREGSEGEAQRPANFDYYEDALERFTRGDHANAIIQLKNTLRRNPDNISARVLLGRAYIEVGGGTSAEKELRAGAAGRRG